MNLCLSFLNQEKLGGGLALLEQLNSTLLPTDTKADGLMDAEVFLGASEENETIYLLYTDAPLTPRISISTYTLKERQSVTVTCSASTRCPHSPPELTWNLQQDSLRQTEKNADGTFTTKIQTTITLTDTHDGYNIRCSARYPMAGKSKTEVAEMTLNVPYAPKNTLASINPSAGTLVELSCSSRAKPPPKITWFKKGPKGITKVATGNSLKVEFTEGDEYYCVAANKLGKQKSSPINLTVKGPSGPEVWILALIGAVGIILLVIIVLIYDNFLSLARLTCLSVDSVLQRLQLRLHLSGQICSDLLSEVRPQLLGLLLPERLGHIEQGAHIHLTAQTFSVDGAIFWQPTDVALLGRFLFPLSAAALEDPLQHAGVFSEPGPEEGAGGGILSEPVNVEDLGQLGGGLPGLHAQPMGEVVAEVVAKERTHGEWVVHDHLTWRKNKITLPSASKDDGIDGNPLLALPLGSVSVTPAAGGSSPSHHTPPSLVSPTLVNTVFLEMVAMA
ncbi:hypothetical protein CCH79_00015991 [Gambusia affinis]|uniref:Ig-like domain-containing protein n=1 Tax=Gambusia affinis TaxID=33528 RepID=A0A315VRS9_GAMAF|nr:hypothetical protein CCH79_00015991 [Gambusia affinis]